MLVAYRNVSSSLALPKLPCSNKVMATKVYYKAMYQTDVSPEVAIPMSSFSLEQLLPGFTISHVRTENTTLTLTAHAVATSATCPSCGQVSAHVHSYYIRSPRDLPIS